jgi:hypothetical protein
VAWFAQCSEGHGQDTLGYYDVYSMEEVSGALYIVGYMVWYFDLDATSCLSRMSVNTLSLLSQKWTIIPRLWCNLGDFTAMLLKWGDTPLNVLPGPGS